LWHLRALAGVPRGPSRAYLASSARTVSRLSFANVAETGAVRSTRIMKMNPPISAASVSSRGDHATPSAGS
jgi:hypothetical protein